MAVSIKKIIKDCLPPLLLQSYYRHRHNFASRRYKRIIAKNKVLKDIYNGERCFVVGNGVSLNAMDLTKLRNEYVFVVNDFYRHKDLNIIRPAFYSSIEPLASMLSYPLKDTNNPYTFYQEVDVAFDNIKPKMFFKADAKDFIKKNGVLKGKEIYYLASGYSGILSAEEGVVLEDKIDRFYSFADGVIFSAICCCAYMGFQEIYFIGCDCDTFSKKGRTHFYSNERTFAETSSEWLMYHNSLLLKRWRLITTHFNKRGINIFNAGIGGDNDVCPRVDYNKIVFK